MKTLLIIFIAFLGFNVVSQIQFETTKHDFGDLEPYDDHFVDIVVKNVLFQIDTAQLVHHFQVFIVILVVGSG